MTLNNDLFQQLKLLGVPKEMAVPIKTKHLTKPKPAPIGLELLLSKIPTEPYYQDKTKTFILFKDDPCKS